MTDYKYFGHNLDFVADTDTEKYSFRIIDAMNLSEVAQKSVSGRPGLILEGTLGSRMPLPSDGTRMGRDGIHLGNWMGPKRCKAHGESGRDPFGPGMGPGRAQDRTLSGPSNRDLRQYSCDTPL